VSKNSQLPEARNSNSIDDQDGSQRQHKPKTGHRKDNFEGDDLDLDDFLEAGSFEKQPKEVEMATNHPNDDVEWILIDGTPSPPAITANISRNKDEEWAADTGPQDEDYEPVRLANGNWACNHKCKNKTR
jgi:ATP-dependent DNA helicase HFM1/MER3